MSHLHVVEKPKVRREPTVLSFIGLVVVFALSIAVPEVIVKALGGEWIVNAVWRFIGIMAIWHWAWGRMGWPS